MYYVYILKNGQGRHYIGSTENIESRLRQHNHNCVTATKNKGPYKLIYKEEFTDKTLARKRENKLKGFKGNSVFKRLLEEGSTPSSSLV
jgi:putative endonuclease